MESYTPVLLTKLLDHQYFFTIALRTGRTFGSSLVNNPFINRYIILRDSSGTTLGFW